MGATRLEALGLRALGQLGRSLETRAVGATLAARAAIAIVTLAPRTRARAAVAAIGAVAGGVVLALFVLIVVLGLSFWMF